MANKLILRSKNSPFTGIFSDINKGSVLSHGELDNNLIYLKGELIYTGTTSGTVLTLHQINGGEIDVDLNSLISSTDNYTTGATLVGDTVYFDRSDLLSAYTLDLSSLDVNDTFTTASTLNGSTIVFNTTDILSAYTVDIGDAIISGITGNTPYRYDSTTPTAIEPRLGANITTTNYSNIGGGYGNVITGTSFNHNYSSMGGGYNNTINVGYSFLGAGYNNRITLSSGFANGNNFLGAGYNNEVNGASSALVGGGGNNFSSNYGIIGAGYGNSVYMRNNGTGAMFGPAIVTGYGNKIIGTDGGGFNIPANGGIIGGGQYNTIATQNQGEFGGVNGHHGILAGNANTISATTIFSHSSIIGGGSSNLISEGIRSFIGAGAYNTISASTDSSIIGGYNNTIPNLNQAHIIGSNITAISANTTHVERFNLGTYDTGSTSNQILVVETNGMVNSVDGSALGVDTFVTGTTFNMSNYDFTIHRNDGTDFTESLWVLASDVNVTGGTYDISTGVVTFTTNSGTTFDVTGFTSGMTDSYTTTAYTVGNEIRFDNNIQGANLYNVDLTDVLTGATASIGANFGNVYFVAPDGDDPTGVRGDILNPFQTLSGARNKAWGEITGGTVTGDTLIYVFPGSYTDEEIQYENGNYYFSPGAEVNMIARVNGGTGISATTALFAIGYLPPKSPQYSATTCNVFGEGTFNCPQSTNGDWNGAIVQIGGSGNTYFECHEMYVEQGIGVIAYDYARATFRGNFLGVETSGYVATSRDYSDTVYEFQRIYNNNVGWPFFIRQGNLGGFYGNCVVNADTISAINYPCIAVQQMRDGGELTVNCSNITSTATYSFQQLQATGGKTTINGNIYGLNGITLSQNSNVYVQLNGNIEVSNTPLNMATNNNETHTFYLNGDIIHETGVANAVTLGRGKLRMNGMIQNTDPAGTGTTFNGINITGSGKLVVDNLKIVTDNLSVTSSSARDIKVIHSLASNQSMNSNITNLITGSNIIIDSEVE